MYAFEVTLHLSIFSLDISLITSSQQVQTSEQGYNSGRSYYFGVPSQEERALWVDGIKKAIESAAIAERRRTGILNRVRLRASSAYHSRWVQGLVALLILANFVSNATQCQLLPPPGSATDSLFNTVDLFFTGARPPTPVYHVQPSAEREGGREEWGGAEQRAGTWPHSRLVVVQSWSNLAWMCGAQPSSGSSSRSTCSSRRSRTSSPTAGRHPPGHMARTRHSAKTPGQHRDANPGQVDQARTRTRRRTCTPRSR